SKDYYYSSLNMGAYAIPVLFYAPGDSSIIKATDTVFQQIDILPSVLDYIGYEKAFFAFGNSIFSDAYPRFVVNEHSGSYQWYMDGFLLSTNNLAPKALYNFKKDSLCTRNILAEKNQAEAKHIV